MEPYKDPKSNSPQDFALTHSKSLRSDTLADAISFALAHASSVLLIKIMQNRIMIPTTAKLKLPLTYLSNFMLLGSKLFLDNSSCFLPIDQRQNTAHNRWRRIGNDFMVDKYRPWCFFICCFCA